MRIYRIYPYRRSGILVLVNDVDWEVMEKEKTELFVCSVFLIQE